MTIGIDFMVNGRSRHLEVSPATTLTEILREDLYLTGTKDGCGVGECGACVVLVDGKPVTSCLVLAGDVNGRVVETIEGISVNEELSAVQEAFVANGAVQCGFCTPAMVVTATALLRETPTPDIAEVRKALGGILCRCGAYPKILDAVTEAEGGRS